MTQYIVLSNQKIAYKIRHSKRSRAVRLTIYPGGELVVTVPRWVSFASVERFMRTKSNWILKKISYLSRLPKQIPRKNTKAEFREYKAKALEIAMRELGRLNQSYRYSWHCVFIKNQKTRWGSCSKKGNLNFNYKIALLPEKMVEYVIVHELCHLKEFNHSKKFWELVAKTVPNYQEIKRDLKNYHLSL